MSEQTTNKFIINADMQLKLRNDTAENWSSHNPVLLKGELAVEFGNDSRCKLKIGDGVTDWNSLPYFNEIDNVTEIVNENLEAKANACDVYTKTEIDSTIGNIADILATVVSGGVE